MRSDAERHREALVQAAAACFAESGFRVPLEIVADRAGVGRGTLYRNFGNRTALALAVFDREIDQLAAWIDPLLPLDRMIATLAEKGDRTFVLLRHLAVEIAGDRRARARFDAMRRRLADALVPAVERAKAAAMLRADADAGTLLLAIAMIGRLQARPKPPEDGETGIAASIRLLMRGLAPR